MFKGIYSAGNLLTNNVQDAFYSCYLGSTLVYGPKQLTSAEIQTITDSNYNEIAASYSSFCLTPLSCGPSASFDTQTVEFNLINPAATRSIMPILG